jgi:hypothetical protein
MARVALLAGVVIVCLTFEARADTPPSTTVLLIAAETSLMVDMLQTSSAIHAGLRESNPLLGPHPSDTKLLAYFSGCMLATAGITYLLPDDLRVFAPVLVLALEVPQIAQNATVRWGFRVPF